MKDQRWTDPPPIASLADRIEPDERRRQRREVSERRAKAPPRLSAKSAPRDLTPEEIQAIRQRSAASVIRTPEQAIKERWARKGRPVQDLDPSRIRNRA
jgi:hypothetical protein